MQVLHQHLLQSSVRTRDPDRAQLFFIPVYLGRHYNWFWQQWSSPGHAWEVHKDCLPTDTPVECFWDKWLRAKEVSLLVPLSVRRTCNLSPGDRASSRGGRVCLLPVPWLEVNGVSKLHCCVGSGGLMPLLLPIKSDIWRKRQATSSWAHSFK